MHPIDIKAGVIIDWAPSFMAGFFREQVFNPLHLALEHAINVCLLFLKLLRKLGRQGGQW